MQAGSVVTRRCARPPSCSGRWGSPAPDRFRFTVGGRRQATLVLRAATLDLSGAAPGAFDVEVDVGTFALTDAGTLRAQGTRLLFP